MDSLIRTKVFNEAVTQMMYDAMTIPAVNIISDICDCPAPIQKTTGWGAKANKKEEVPMASYAHASIIADTTEKDQRRFAGDRLVTIFYDKKSALKKQFGLIDDEAPKTPAEFIKRIADGMYTIDKDKMDKETYGPERYIRWRDPSKVEDKAGYDAAKKALEDAYTKAKDKVALGAAADLLAAVEAFDGWTLS